MAFEARYKHLERRKMLAKVLQEEDSGVLRVLWHSAAAPSAASLVARRLFMTKRGGKVWEITPNRIESRRFWMNKGRKAPQV